MKNKKRLEQTFQKKMTLMFVGVTLFSILMISISLLFYFTFSARRSIVTTLGMAIENNASAANDFFSKIDLSMQILKSDTSYFPKLLLDKNVEAISMMQNFNQIRAIFKSNMDMLVTETVPYYMMIYFVDNSVNMYDFLPSLNIDWTTERSFNAKSLIFKDDKVKNDEWYKRVMENGGETYWFAPDGNDMTLCGAKLLVLNDIVGNSINRRELGVVCVSFDVPWIVNKINTTKLTKRSSIILSDNNGNIVYTTNQQIKTGNINDYFQAVESSGKENMNTANIRGEMFYFKQNTLSGGLNLTAMIPTNDVDNILQSDIWIVIFIAAIMMSAGIAMVLYVSRIIAKPIKKLSSHMQHNDKFEEISCETFNSDEVNGMYESYNILINRIKSLINQVYDSVENEKRTKLSMLQAQINPHFLYNSLNSISCISLVKGEKATANALSNLANIMRYNIKEPDAFVSVNDEIEQIYNYIALQKLKYGDQVELAIDINEQYKNCLIPKMIIQPIVENSVNHGFNYLENPPLNIHIRVDTNKNNLIISVSDNGVCKNVELINEHIKGNVNISKNMGGLGVRNVNERIKMEFGNEYSLFYKCSEQGETVAVITVPNLKQI